MKMSTDLCLLVGLTELCNRTICLTSIGSESHEGTTKDGKAFVKELQ